MLAAKNVSLSLQTKIHKVICTAGVLTNARRYVTKHIFSPLPDDLVSLVRSMLSLIVYSRETEPLVNMA